MEKRRPWQPRMKDQPLFNPFEPWGQWTEQFEDGDPIAIEGEAEAKESVPRWDAASRSTRLTRCVLRAMSEGCRIRTQATQTLHTRRLT